MSRVLMDSIAVVACRIRCLPSSPTAADEQCALALLFLFVVNRVLLEPRAVLLNLQFFPARLTTKCVVVVAGFFANQVHNFQLLLSFTFFLGHARLRNHLKGENFFIN